MRYNYTPIRTAKIKKFYRTICWQRGKRALTRCHKEHKMTQLLQKKAWHFLRK